MDVARKVVILARECGVRVELEDVKVESLVPEPLKDTPSVLDFMGRLPQVCLTAYWPRRNPTGSVT